MKQLFINSFLHKDYHALATKLELVLIMWIIVLVAIIIDLVSGIKKAKELGELRTSVGFRRTVSKGVQYYGLLCFAFMFDLLGSFFFPLPYFTMLATFFLVFVEAKSVFEKAQDKDRRKMNDSIKDLVILLEHKDDLLNGIKKLLKDKEEEKENDTRL